MPETVPAVKAHAEIPLGIVEFTVQFETPLYDVWKDATSLIQVVLAKMEPFGFKLDGVEIKIPEKLNDRVIIFRRSYSPNFVFNVGVGRMWYYAENLDWSQADQALSCMGAGISAVQEVSKYKAVSQSLTLAMHIQVQEKPVSEVTASLLSSSALALLDGDIKVHGIILIRDKATILLDASAGVANAVFVRITREHSPTKTLQEIAETLHKDEEHLFNTLGIEGVL
jgi:hypothetical protein